MYINAGNILLIKDFQFEDGGETRDKYLIVVATNNDQSTFIRCLPTSKQYVPDNKVTHGCRNNEIYSYFIFLQDRPVCDNNFAFPKHTFVYYSNNVLQLSIADFRAKSYDITLIGKLTSEEYGRLIKCMKASRHIKRELKPINDAITTY